MEQEIKSKMADVSKWYAKYLDRIDPELKKKNHQYLKLFEMEKEIKSKMADVSKWYALYLDRIDTAFKKKNHHITC